MLPHRRAVDYTPLLHITESLLGLISGKGWMAAIADRLGWQDQLRIDRCALTFPGPEQALAPLRIAFASDFHAGPTTHARTITQACQVLRDLQPDLLLLGGDFVSYRASHIEALAQQLGEVPAPCGRFAVLGNHDQAVVRGAGPQMRPEARYVVDWTRSQLDASQLDFLASLPLTQRQGDQFYAHANAWAPGAWEYIAGRSDAVRSLHATDCRYTFCGHAHEPKLFHVSSTGKAGDFIPTPGVAIPVPPHRQWLVIPGSAGQPRDGNPAACYAMLDEDQALLTFHRVPYDHESAGAKILAAKLPHRLASRLEQGQ